MAGLDAVGSNRIFNAIAPCYDALNTLLSFGRHNIWRARMARWVPLDAHRVLDIAVGTADVSLALGRACPQIKNIIGVDIAQEMLRKAQEKISNTEINVPIELVTGNALQLPFKCAIFDVVTTAFSLRNVPDVLLVLLNAWKVLKPGGTIMILEFARPNFGPAVVLQRFYLKFCLPIIGFLLTGNWAAYYHLGNSILSFPHGTRFHRMLKQVGFKDIQEVSMAWGSVALYRAVKQDLL